MKPKYIIIIFSLLLLLISACDVLQEDTDTSPFTYNANIAGYVEFEQGSPDTLVANVRAYKTDSNILMSEAYTDTSGYYSMENLSFGDYQLTIAAENYGEQTLQVTAQPHATTVVDTTQLQFIEHIQNFAVIIDGSIDAGWDVAYENTHTSGWSSSNDFHNFYISHDEDSLYVGVDGGFDASGNAVNFYIDKDYGAGTGISDFSTIEGGGYGDHLRKDVVAPEAFGADLAFTGWALQSDIGVVSLEFPTEVDDHLLESNQAMNPSVVEFAISFEQIYGEPGCPYGTVIAVVAIIGGGGDQYVADDTIPQQDDPHNFTTVFNRQF
ncbi:MAG: carboxypeptidase regulatory-like domain-containing protein [Candidatus Cloacimonetes bacterium]|nr:carboxypeptidase regulatory-like domain-containing protein [Candidatus Cloacimonadota bacterium]